MVATNSKSVLNLCCLQPDQHQLLLPNGLFSNHPGNLREVLKKWKFRMAFAIKGGGGGEKKMFKKHRESLDNEINSCLFVTIKLIPLVEWSQVFSIKTKLFPPIFPINWKKRTGLILLI